MKNPKYLFTAKGRGGSDVSYTGSLLEYNIPVLPSWYKPPYIIDEFGCWEVDPETVVLVSSRITGPADILYYANQGLNSTNSDAVLEEKNRLAEMLNQGVL